MSAILVEPRTALQGFSLAQIPFHLRDRHLDLAFGNEPEV